MKKTIIATAFALSAAGIASAQNSPASKALWYRLNVPPQNLADGQQKSVGGLTCTSKIASARTEFNCTVSMNQIDAAAIYAALDANEKINSGTRPTVISTKTAGPLTCTKTERGQNVYYDCDLKLKP